MLDTIKFNENIHRALIANFITSNPELNIDHRSVSFGDQINLTQYLSPRNTLNDIQGLTLILRGLVK